MTNMARSHLLLLTPQSRLQWKCVLGHHSTDPNRHSLCHHQSRSDGSETKCDVSETRFDGSETRSGGNESRPHGTESRSDGSISSGELNDERITLPVGRALGFAHTTHVK